MGHNNHYNNHDDDDPTQGQLQGQAELQGQLQAQAELQGQGQGQGQGQHQGQSQYAGQYAGQAVDTSVWNAAVNGNLNGNGNLNANGNLNVNDNVNNIENTVDNEVNNCVNVDVNVDLGIEGSLLSPADPDAIDIDSIHDIEEAIIMPDVVNQTAPSGNNFNIDQVNNLTDNDRLHNPTVAYSGGGSDGGGPAFSSSPWDHGGGDESSGDFTLVAIARGGHAESAINDITGDDGDFSGVGSSSAAASITQEAFTQSIVQGANIQFNSIELTVGSTDDSL